MLVTQFLVGPVLEQLAHDLAVATMGCLHQCGPAVCCRQIRIRAALQEQGYHIFVTVVSGEHQRGIALRSCISRIDVRAPVEGKTNQVGTPEIGGHQQRLVRDVAGQYRSRDRRHWHDGNTGQKENHAGATPRVYAV